MAQHNISMDELESQNTNPSQSGLASVLAFIWDFLKVIIIALAIILPVRYFLFQPFIVSGSSMEPNFSHGEYLIIDEISYRFNEPKRGDVIVLHFPKDRKQFFIKRIVGMPGESVAIDNGRVTIKNEQHPEGTVLEEPYLPNQGLTFPHNTALIGGKKNLALGPNEYLVLGDNRLASSDSRDWGILERKDVVGKTFVRVLPLTEIEHFKAPDYSF